MRQPVTIERLENALLQAARLLEQHGEVLRPIVDRLEREYIDATARPASETDRVRELIRRTRRGFSRDPSTMIAQQL